MAAHYSDVVTGIGLSIFDPVYLGVDEFGLPVRIPMMYRNILIGGEPGAGKSAVLNNVVAHAALSVECRLCLIDGKQVELGQWEDCADVFIGPEVGRAIATLARVETVMNNRYTFLRGNKRRKNSRTDTFSPILIAIDEIAYFSATAGDRKTQDAFSSKLRDLAARGRAVGIMVAAATQRPSSDIIPTSLRALFAWRFAGRCTDDASSDVVLGHGWAAKGWTANSIDPNNPGAGLLIAEGGTPQRVKPAFLSDEDCARIAAHAVTLRRAVTS
jgi:S-DNA-T family DNA segregation ATPase FtsK/SpoIIIE